MRRDQTRPRAAGFFRIARSLRVRFALLALIFLAVPLILYSEFRDADKASQQLLLHAVREKGVIAAESIEPLLATSAGAPFDQLAAAIARYGSPTLRVELLFQPKQKDGTAGSFFFVASAPTLGGDELERERRELLQLGVLHHLTASCAGEMPLAQRITAGKTSDQLLTSITPISTPAGCFALLILDTDQSPAARQLGRPYWESGEVRIAASIYLAMAILVLAIFLDLWRGIERFGRLARAIRRGGSPLRFTERNRLPELDVVAREFDAMVETLHHSAEGIRRSAEDNAHALKNPLGIIRQACELLRRRAVPGEPTQAHALSAIGASLDRLDGLISSARRLDQAMADLLEPPLDLLDLTALVRRTVAGFQRAAIPGGASLDLTAADGLRVRGGEDLLETVLENVIDNAQSFTPAWGCVRIALARRGGNARLTIEDDGPGVAPEQCERIFDRYYSRRQEVAGNADSSHFGIGLWIVRRNVEALGGQVSASNRPQGGLCVTIEIPLAS